jgi:hypothetical protein
MGATPVPAIGASLVNELGSGGKRRELVVDLRRVGEVVAVEVLVRRRLRFAIAVIAARAQGEGKKDRETEQPDSSNERPLLLRKSHLLDGFQARPAISRLSNGTLEDT